MYSDMTSEAQKRASAKWDAKHSRLISLKYYESDYWKIEALSRIAKERGVSLSRLYKDETERLLASGHDPVNSSGGGDPDHDLNTGIDDQENTPENV